MLKKIKNILKKRHKHLPRIIEHASFKNYQIALHFDGEIQNLYQLIQWVSIIDILNKKQPTIIIARDLKVYNWLRTHTSIGTIFLKNLTELMSFYQNTPLKCLLYVNNSTKNFQSLINRDSLHIHINHGESDKTSTISNQSKAYDCVLISGDAAYDKYYLNLINVDMNKFIKIGRPQLEHVQNTQSIQTNKKIVLYAPTWEGTHDTMNYTSINDYGIKIVNMILKDPNYYLVYKPHPNTGSINSETKRINRTLIKLIQKNKHAIVFSHKDINSLFPHIDIAIFDNSAVAVDYLKINKPMFIVDKFNNQEKRSKPTIIKAAIMISNNNINNLIELIKKEIEHDSIKEQRNKVKKYFLGEYDYSKKESTDKFISTILDICKKRDRMKKELEKANETHAFF